MKKYKKAAILLLVVSSITGMVYLNIQSINRTKSEEKPVTKTDTTQKEYKAQPTVWETVYPPSREYTFPRSEDNGDKIFTPIYGIDSVIASKTAGLDKSLETILPKVKIEYDPEEDLSSDPDIKLMNCIETNPAFENLKRITNTTYSIYTLEGKIGQAYGKYTMDYMKHCFNYIVFNKNTPKGFFISGTRNHMPRPVEVYVNVNYDKDKTKILKLKDFDNSKLIETGKILLGNNRDIVIAQYFECDVNNDGKREKIVNYNNVLTSSEFSDCLYKKTGVEKYYSVITILDERFEPISFIHDQRDFVGLDINAWHEGMVYIEYVVDINSDNQMDFICYMGGYEWYGYKTSFLEGKEVKNDYYWYFW